MINRLCSLLAVLVIGLAAQSSNAANLIVNGGFEIPVVPGGDYYHTLTAGDTSMAPWIIQSGSVDVVTDAFWQAFEARQSLDLNGISPATITQTFATTPGTQYSLTFEYANNPNSTNPPNPAATATVSVIDSGGGTLLSQAITHSGSSAPNMGYTPFSGSFVADTTATVLQFAGTNPGPFGIVLDAVSVIASTTVVPEPSTIALASIAGLMGLGYGWRRRKAKLAA